MLQPALASFPAAMTLATATLSSGQSGLYQSLVLPQISMESPITVSSSAGVCTLSTSALQSCTVGSTPGGIPSSLFSVLVPEVSRLSTAPGFGECSRRIPSCNVTASQWTAPGAVMHNNTTRQNPSAASEVQTGLDLGNGWKVVGLTPLIETLPQQPESLPTPSPGFVSPSNPVSSVNQSNSSTPSSTDSEQWKIVGLTSLNPGVGIGAADTPSAVRPVCLFGPQDIATSTVGTRLMEAPARAPLCGLQNLHPKPTSESTLKTCDWKIAGITTLPIPPIPAVSLQSAKPPETAESSTSGQKCSESSSASSEEPKWRVVGVTALPPPLPDKPTSLAAPVSVAAMATPVSTSTEGLTPLVGDGGWKVVGVVPLPQGGDVSVCKNTPCQEECHVASVKMSYGNSPSPQPKVSQNLAEPRGTPKKENKKHHPLSFLPNCSNQFRNAILKKNTVSTMLELKRAYQQKLRREGKLLVPAPSGLNIPVSRSKLVTHLKMQDSKHSAQVETDDKAVLSELYNSQLVCEVKQEPSAKPCDAYDSEVGQRREQTTEEKVSVLESWHVYNAERGELVMSDSGSSSDGVNLTAVDPWGVCTDDDMDDVADMMASKGEKKSLHSSSRKRKLSTPRKMVQ
ncbi:hypothetical protein BaRGS_00011469 [Batillaria attramentaria]|uniref:Uncharacterized protein n=1 Tax=Batillaria attramentaria TaxID=370345 RepID=A0ABD0LCS3_9CAEN